MTARIEIFKAAFLIVGFIAIGFAAGVWYARAAVLLCPPPWLAAGLVI